MGVLMGKPDATPLGVTVGGGRGLEVKLRFWGARDARDPRADSASEVSEDRSMGSGVSARFCGASEARSPREDSTSAANEEKPDGMGISPRFTEEDAGVPDGMTEEDAGVPDGMTEEVIEGKGTLVLEGANGLGRGTSTEICEGLGMPVLENETEALVDWNGNARAVPERARARHPTEAFILNERRWFE